MSYVRATTSVYRVGPMAHVTFRLSLLLVIFLMGQSNAVSNSCGELKNDISQLRKLNHRNELLLGQCYEQLKTESHISEAAFRSLQLAEDEINSKLQLVEQSEAVNNDLKKQLDTYKIEHKQADTSKRNIEKQLDEFRFKLRQSDIINKDLEKQLRELKFKLQKSDATNNYLNNQVDQKTEVLKSKDAKQKEMQTAIDALNNRVDFLKTLQRVCCENMTFYIQSVYSGKYLSIKGNRTNIGTDVVIDDVHGGKNQQWTYIKGMIVSKLNGLVLDISRGKQNGGIIMWPENGGDNQKWYFDDDLTIRSALGFALDVKDGSKEESSKLVAYAKNGLASQKFRIVPLEYLVFNTNNAKKAKKAL